MKQVPEKMAIKLLEMLDTVGCPSILTLLIVSSAVTSVTKQNVLQRKRQGRACSRDLEGSRIPVNH